MSTPTSPALDSGVAGLMKSFISRRVFSNNPQPILDFTSHVNTLRRGYCGQDGNGKRQTYIPVAELARYWDRKKVQTICKAFSPEPLSISFDAVNPPRLRLFSILVYADKIQYFKSFLEHNISDLHLPIIDVPTVFQSAVYQEAINGLLKYQWLFCPLVLECAYLSNVNLDARHILPFHDEEEIKRGDSAHVYKVKVDKTCDKLHKIEGAEDRTYVLKSYTGDRYRTLYQNEEKALTTLQRSGTQSEHVVGYYGSFIQNGKFNLLLEFADGGNLLDYYRSTPKPRGASDTKQFWWSLLGVLKGLHYVHQVSPDDGYRGIHEDIKPDNIILRKGTSESSYDFRAILVDFGHSHFRVADSEWDRMGVDREGNQTYGAPECSRHAEYLRRVPGYLPTAADIFSMGCVISDAASWVAFGLEGRNEYRKLRTERGSKVSNFEDEGHYDCFHNAVTRSPAVDEMHARIRQNCLPDDTITPLLLDLVESYMLLDWKSRLDAREVYERFVQFYPKPEGEPHQMAGKEDSGEEYTESPLQVPRTLKAAAMQAVINTRKRVQDGIKEARANPVPSTRPNDLGRSISNDSTVVNAGTAMAADPGASLLRPPAPADPSASPKLPPRPGPAPVQPQSPPYLDISGSFRPLENASFDSTSRYSDNADMLSPPLDADFAMPSTPTNLVEDVTSLAELHLTLADVRTWRENLKNLGQNDPDKHRIIKSLQRSLRGRDHIFFVDESRTMSAHANEVLSVFETLRYVVKPQNAKDGGNLWLVLGAVGGGANRPRVHRDQRTFKLFQKDDAARLVKVLRNEATYERIETMIEDLFSDLIDTVIIPLLPSQNPHRDSVSGTSASQGKKKTYNPVSLIVFTDGRWGTGRADGGGVQNPIRRLIEQIKARDLKRTQVMVQFIRFGNEDEGIRNLWYLADFAREQEMEIVDTRPVNGNVCEMLIGSISHSRPPTETPFTQALKDKLGAVVGTLA